MSKIFILWQLPGSHLVFTVLLQFLQSWTILLQLQAADQSHCEMFLNREGQRRRTSGTLGPNKEYQQEPVTQPGQNYNDRNQNKDQTTKPNPDI